MSQLQPADGGEGEYYDEEDGEGEAAEDYWKDVTQTCLTLN